MIHKIERRGAEEGRLYLNDGLLYTLGDGEWPEASAPTEVSNDLFAALYDHYQCNEGISSGDSVELDGVVIGHYHSFHFIPVSEWAAYQEGL